MARKYHQRQRAEHRKETRGRIVDAALALHGTIGPARTTITAIAEGAGVERLTVYRHFPDDLSLFAACGARFVELHPPPYPGEWAVIPDPVDRLRRTLAALYAFYDDNEAMLLNSERDAELLPQLREALAPFTQYRDAVKVVLASGWAPGGDFDLRDAALGHALEFPTWQSLVRRQQLTQAEAVELMVRSVMASADRRDWQG